MAQFPNKASEKNILLSVDTSSLKNKDIYSDPDKLRQLMLHLVNNAIAYTKSGGKVDIIVSELKKLPNDYAVYQLTVKDNGIGISEEFLERIFEPFERENNTTQSGVHGMGLGLTIVKNIVDMIGGEIKVASTLGKGSTFTIVARMRIQQEKAANKYALL
ncbi:alkaline phosphatase synthesis sensor protein PhoR [Clostridiales bacterium]|nr:alkaline phosphatase synthesis sensor protein PhoR [Clostridiales bacterium]